MHETHQAVNRVLTITLVLNLLVAFGKILTGLLTGALSITADGFHSLADGASNVVALVATRIAGTPPDRDHPYGHQRFETLAALGIGFLLLLTAWETIRGVIEHFSGGAQPEITPLSFAVMLVTLVINLGVNRYEAAEGKRLKSEVLLADAAHTGADIYVTLSVLVSLTIIVVFKVYWIDSITALVVVGLIGRAAWRIVRRTGSVLVDTAPITPEQLTALALQTPAVTGVARARSRGSVDAVTIDIELQVAPETTADRTAAIASAVEDNMRAQVPGVLEVNVQFLPTEPRTRDYHLLAEVTAEALGLDAHHIYLNPSAEGDVLELHVEVPAGQTLDHAHQLVSDLEDTLQRRLPQLARIVTHIEPASIPIPVEHGTVPASRQLSHQVMDILKAHYPAADWHDLQVYEQPRGTGITLHASLAPTVTIEEAHDLAAAAERLLRAEIGGLDRITIHTEPLAENVSLSH